jgi:hypothetical protein
MRVRFSVAAVEVGAARTHEITTLGVFASKGIQHLLRLDIFSSKIHTEVMPFPEDDGRLSRRRKAMFPNLKSLTVGVR